MKIGNKEYPTKFGINQSILYCEQRNVSISKMQEEFDAFAKGTHNGGELRDLIWSALKDGARVAKVDFPFSNTDVGDWMEDIDAGEIQNMLEDMLGDLPKAKKADAKKKVITKQQ